MRITYGFGCGINMMIGQVYITESSPMLARSSATLSYILSIFLGFILSHISSIIFAYQLKIIFALGLIPSIISLFMLIFT